MLKDILEQGCLAADAALERLLPAASQYPEVIHKAMRHSVFAGGKRLRPILAMEAARLISTPASATAARAGDPGFALNASPAKSSSYLPDGVDELGAALEMLHTYSLIHDDLPALDNDDLRRGRPTCHKVYGEAMAILAGDGLQTYAYEVMARLRCSAEARVRIIAEVAHATGTVDGMVGGQVMDIEAEGKKIDAATLEYIHRSKTGALITGCLVAGALYANATDAEILRVREFGRLAGLAFQIADDILDVTQTSEQLGKTAGKDIAAEKMTYPALYGLEASERKAKELIDAACAQLDPFSDRAATLKELARFLVERKK
jgi:geranylgeranyl diphosphate synthase, type II